jgi:(1->4)-alpha-D-glucan 1-alpha-D-glucosylmutase
MESSVELLASASNIVISLLCAWRSARAWYECRIGASVDLAAATAPRDPAWLGGQVFVQFQIQVMHSDESKPRLRVPRATYRIQFNRDFTFRDAARLVPYLDALGISDLYASPYLQARPGSTHGYDVFNHNVLNPEVGSEEEYRTLASVAREHDMGHLLDIVPNHMGISGNGNEWWNDVLENGPSSPFAPYFDIDWYPLSPALSGKVLLPVLGDQFGEVLERGELKLAHEDGRFWIEYYENRFPTAPRSITGVLSEALEHLRKKHARDFEALTELESIMTALRHLPPRDRTDPESVAERQRERLVSRRRLATLYESSTAARQAIDQAVERINGTVGEPHSFDLLHELLDGQAYRLAFWRVAAEEINYRRFFDINDLAGVRVEQPQVFEATHRLILKLVAEGIVTGLRVDHPDGLFNPQKYLRDLQDAASEEVGGEPQYVLVEKILTGDEPLPDDWPVAGTVGYDFMNRIGGLFVDRAAEAALDQAYARFVGRVPEFGELAYTRKKLVLRNALASELTVLAYLLDRLSEQNRRVRDFTLGNLTHALRETIACFPVYRTYIDAHTGRIGEQDRAHVEQAIRLAKRTNPATNVQVFDFVRDLLLLRWPEGLDEETRAEHARFVMKFQQLTGPVMAKGVEDTSFYIYNRLVSLNEVGGEPDHFGFEPQAFHRWMQERQRRWPHAMNSSSTHDTKRSEDVRARIHLLSELADEWQEHALRWAELNRAHRTDGEFGPIPEPNDEYLLYQSLVGVWPIEQELAPDEHEALVTRVQQYMEKATREAKLRTSWINPNEEYDEELKRFVGAVLDRDANAEFFRSFLPFQRKAARLGMINSLAQTLLKLTCPGVPDIYQGQELWDFSLVDPDNRRPVDYAARKRLLERHQATLQREDRRKEARDWIESWQDGRVKLFLTYLTLRHRAEHPELYAEGEYLPLAASGPKAEHVFAFARRHGSHLSVTVVPRLVARLYGPTGFVAGGGDPWGDTYLEVPAEWARDARDVLTGALVEDWPIAGSSTRLPLATLLRDLPVALLSR